MTSSPAGISCGAACAASYTSGTAVTLTGTPAAGSTFAGWSGGGCTGTSPCALTLSGTTGVTATFTQGHKKAKLVVSAGQGGSPSVAVFADTSGTLSATTPRFMAYDPRFQGGVFVAAGDLRGDGSVQIITGTGAGGGPHVPTFNADGTDFGVNFMAYDPSFTGGVRVASCDVDGDGQAEIITAAGPGAGPHVRIWKVVGATVRELAGFFAYAPTFTGGVFVACGDLDGDGRAEIITAAGAGGGPHVAVWKVDGNGTIQPLTAFFPYDPGFRGGVFVAAGDLDGDGRAELITGVGPGGGPHVAVWSVANDGTVSWVTGFFAYDPGFRGGVRVAAADLYGDGRAELVTGAGVGGGPHVALWTVAANGTVSPTTSFFAYDPGFTGGVFVAGSQP